MLYMVKPFQKHSWHKTSEQRNFVTEKKNDLEAIHKVKTTLTLIKPAYVVMCVLEVSKVSTINSIMIISKSNINIKKQQVQLKMLFLKQVTTNVKMFH